MSKNEHSQENSRLLSFKEVQRITGLSRSTIYRQVKRGDFPRPRSISERKVGFLENELEFWIQGREFSGSLVE